MMTAVTLLVGYYHGLLLETIDADLLKDKLCSIGLLTAHQEVIISSGHSVYQKNRLLLNHVQQMDVQAFLTFSELVQEIWPQVGSQLISGMYVLLPMHKHLFKRFLEFYSYIRILLLMFLTMHVHCPIYDIVMKI